MAVDLLFEQQVENSARSVSYLAGASVEAVITEDIPVLETVIAQAMQNDQQIHAVRFTNEDGKVLASSVMTDHEHGVAMRHSTAPMYLIPHSEFLSRSSDIVVGGEKFGTVTVIWHTHALFKAFSGKLPIIIAAIAAVMLLATAAIVTAVHVLVVRPINGINERLVSLSTDEFANAAAPPAFASKDIRALNDAVTEFDLGVVERHRAEMAMQTSDARLRAILDGSPAAITMKDRDGRYLVSNDTYARWANTDTSGILWRTFDDFGDPHIIQQITAADQRVFSAGKPEMLELGFVWPDGIHRDVLIYKTPVRTDSDVIDGVATTTLDITERKLAETEIRDFNEKLEILVNERTEALYASETRFRHALEEAPIAIALVDLDGVRFKVNQAMADFLGYTIEELTGTNLTDTVVYPEDRQRGAQLRKQLLAGEIDSFRNETRYRHKDGHILWGEVNVALVRLSDNIPLHYIIHVVDVSEGKLAENQRKEAEAQLIQAEKLATLGTLAAGAAHELSQPLNIIRIISDSAAFAADESAQEVAVAREELQVIAEQVTRMAQIIEHMNIFSRKDDQPGAVFSPAQAVRRVVSIVEKQFAADGVVVSSEIQEPCGNVLGAEGRLGQVVLNLLTNARDAVSARNIREEDAGHSFSGKINLKVSADEQQNRIYIDVMDNGGGIDAEVFKNIFDPVFTTKEVGTGTGLGLSVSHSIIESMGGTLIAANVPEGACFQISLPLGVSAQHAGMAVAEGLPEPNVDGPAPVIDEAAAKCSVLIVDDEFQASKIFARTMRSRGYEVVTAGNGLEALEAYRARPVDIVITDIQMPQMDGQTLIGHLREISPSLPIFVTTGKIFSDDESDDITGTHGVHLVQKPIDLAEITNKIDEIMAA